MLYNVLIITHLLSLLLYAKSVLNSWPVSKYVIKHILLFSIIGEFGIVYKGVLINWHDTPLQTVAVKALKGRYY